MKFLAIIGLLISSLAFGESLGVVAGESFSVTQPKMASFRAGKILTVKSSNSWLEVSENAGTTYPIQIPYKKYQKRDLAENMATYGLDQVVETLLNDHASLGGTYTFAYDPATGKMGWSATGVTTFEVKCKTGTHGSDNADNHACSLLGFGDTADLTGSNTYTAASAPAFEDKVLAFNTLTTNMSTAYASGVVTKSTTKGNDVVVQTSGVIPGFTGLTPAQKYVTNDSLGSVSLRQNAVSGSQEIGYSLSPTTMMLKFLDYLSLIPGSWKTTPVSYDAGAEIQNGDMNCNASGYCVRIILLSSPATYKFQYSSNGGLTWSTSSSSISTGTSYPGENYGGNYYLKPRIVIDDNGYGVAAMTIYASGTAVYQSHTSDYGVTWSSASILTADSTHYIGGLSCRENKCVILTNFVGNNFSQIFISNNTGSGYATWSAAVALDYDYAYTVSSPVYIQYFGTTSDPTIAADYRIVSFGYRVSAGDPYPLSYNYCDGSGSGKAYGDLDTNNNTTGKYPIASGIDKWGTRNKIVVFSYPNATTTLRQMDSNDSSSSFSWNTHGYANIGNSFSIDTHNGYSSADGGINLIWNDTNRLVVLGSYAYAIIQTNANTGSLPAATLFSTTNLTGGTWTSTNVGLQAGAVQESSLCYVPSVNGLVLVYKYNTAGLANNLTNGQIWARYTEISGSGALNWMDHIQIDGGKTMSGFAGFAQAVCTNDGAVVTYEQLLSTYDGLFGQALQ